MDGVGVDGSPPTSDPENPGGLNQGPGRPLDAPPSYDEVIAEMEAELPSYLEATAEFEEMQRALDEFDRTLAEFSFSSNETASLGGWSGQARAGGALTEVGSALHGDVHSSMSDVPLEATGGQPEGEDARSLNASGHSDDALGWTQPTDGAMGGSFSLAGGSEAHSWWSSERDDWLCEPASPTPGSGNLADCGTVSFHSEGSSECADDNQCVLPTDHITSGTDGLCTSPSTHGSAHLGAIPRTSRVQRSDAFRGVNDLLHRSRGSLGGRLFHSDSQLGDPAATNGQFFPLRRTRHFEDLPRLAVAPFTEARADEDVLREESAEDTDENGLSSPGPAISWPGPELVPSSPSATSNPPPVSHSLLQGICTPIASVTFGAVSGSKSFVDLDFFVTFNVNSIYRVLHLSHRDRRSKVGNQ